MSQLDLSYYGLQELPRFGKDHLALADWRLSVPHQRSCTSDGQRLAAVEYEFDHPSGKKKISLAGGAKVGLPTDADDLFLIGLLTLAAGRDFPEKLHFEPSHVLQVLRMPVKDRHITRQRQAYERFVALTAMFEGAWFDRQAKQASGDFITGILAEVYYEPKRGRRRKGEQPASYVQFTHNFHESLLHGNLINIDLELLSSWSSPTAALLFRHLNKVWHHGRKPFLYSRDLKDLACGQLHMTDGKNLKENFGQVLREMEVNGYLRPIDKEKRFERIRRGVCRVHFELHPERVIQPKQSTQQKSPAARDLVCYYEELRHGLKSYQPAEHELKHAAELLTQFDVDAVKKITPRIVETIKRQNQSDVYFGFAVPYYQKELRQRSQAENKTQRQSAVTSQAETDSQRLQDRERQRSAERDRRLQIWRSANQADLEIYVERALQKTTSEAARNRILDSTLENPAPEVLREVPLTPLS